MQSKEEIAAYQKAWYERNKEKVTQKHKAWYERNKEEHNAKGKAWREAHKEEIAAYDKAYREANKEKVAAKDKAYYQANRKAELSRMKAYREAHKEEAAAYKKAYLQTEAGKKIGRQSQRKRRAMKASVNEHFTKVDEAETLNKFNHQCFRCGMTAEDHKAKWNESIHIDHLYPLSEGNALTQNNAIILCKSCNASKGAKNPSEFFTIKQLHELRKKGLF